MQEPARPAHGSVRRDKDRCLLPNPGGQRRACFATTQDGAWLRLRVRWAFSEECAFSVTISLKVLNTKNGQGHAQRGAPSENRPFVSETIQGRFLSWVFLSLVLSGRLPHASALCHREPEFPVHKPARPSPVDPDASPSAGQNPAPRPPHQSLLLQAGPTVPGRSTRCRVMRPPCLE